MIGVSTLGGISRYVFSDPFQIARGVRSSIEHLTYTDTPPPLPVSLGLSASPITLTAIGQTVQIHTLATLGGGVTQDVTPHTSWTTYRTSNPAIATVNEDGLVTARGEGPFLITASNGGATGVLRLNVVPGDPLTTVEGFVQRQNGAPVQGAVVRLVSLPNTDTTDAGGHFSIRGVATRVVNPIQATAIATVLDSTLIGEGSAPPVPGGITDLGIIVVTPVAAVFETQLGTKFSMGDDTFFSYSFSQGFTFPFYGTTQTGLFVGSNGYLTFGSGDRDYTENLSLLVNGRPRISAFFDDLYPPTAPADGGVFVNQLPDRLIVTWNKLPHYSSGGSFTIQAVIFANGRIQFGYRGISSLNTGSGAGITPGGTPPYRNVDFSAGPVAGAPDEALVQLWAGSPFDLDMGFLLFTPAGNAYNAQFIPPPPLVGSALVVGRVEDAQGHPMPNCRIETSLSAGGTCSASARTDADGSFRVDHVPLGGMLTVAAFDPANASAPPMIGWIRPLQNGRVYEMRVTEVPVLTKAPLAALSRPRTADARAEVSNGPRALPATLTLEDLRPNPFASELVTSFGLPRAGDVSLEIYDIAGRRVATLAEGRLDAGWHRFAWSGTDGSGSALKSGVYSVRLRQGDVVRIRRAVLIR